MFLNKEIHHEKETALINLNETPILCRATSIPIHQELAQQLATRSSRRMKHSFSPNIIHTSIDMTSPDFPTKTNILSSGRSSLPNRTKYSFITSDQPKDQLKAKAYEKELASQDSTPSPGALEPQSSSSHQIESFSGLEKEQIIFPDLLDLQRTNSWELMFNSDYYRRINDYLDVEGLELSDPVEEAKGVRNFKVLRLSRKNSFGEDSKSLQNFPQSIRSEDHMPTLISTNIISSTLYQRRASRSQGPENVNEEKPHQLHIFKFSKEAHNSLSQLKSPIEEAITPVMSRDNSGQQESVETPVVVLKRYSSRQYKSPQTDIISCDETRWRKRNAKPEEKHPRFFHSPNIVTPASSGLNAESSFEPLERSRKAVLSLHTSPTTCNFQRFNKRTKQKKKSYFQKISEIEFKPVQDEMPPYDP